ncbi:alpha/beta hydrolase [Alienimonas californiensis]|uniref:Alpha/beta hydrolase family protein n=1 Tax=Alienimonas californiensis TaxID=2527989 RepID=A0A517P3R5_9PLAN|nr:fibronectin type III domain-containing protein [Alienimonas californiensis]QDT14016.1 hypothetical protein CA12_00840 [Alienimonas californiensis]
MTFRVALLLLTTATCLTALPAAPAQEALPADPYADAPEVAPPVYRVRYEASSEPGALRYPVRYAVWVPPGVERLRGVIVHQHGCGTGSCKSGLTGAFDLHWQALAAAHDCALLSPSYEQPEQDDCRAWCDPRNGSAEAFLTALRDLGEASGHPELAEVPWALWGHSGGGVWAGGMTLLYPDRVAATWLRSGVPLVEKDDARLELNPHTLPEAALGVPMVCNLGTQEGVTVTDGRFSGVWPKNQVFFDAVRGAGGLIAVAIDPKTSHECGNQRYLAIPWFDVCLSHRLPESAGEPLRPMPTGDAHLADLRGQTAVPAADYAGDAAAANWLPNAEIAARWEEYVTNADVADVTPPPAPTNVRIEDGTLRWDAAADLQSGVRQFVIERDGEPLAQVPEKPTNPHGRPLFQGLQYSDTPLQPLRRAEFELPADLPTGAALTVRAVNSVGLSSEPSAPGN